ncbi:conserved unknown protein [Ectocarpus siliculosus]|uniref:Ribosomal protein S6 n=1 Tax=Ectocarpus siliculosus TaxID=2880 RepID=D8LLJ6_ECTSI|nr:conserved unknown protein [Ectocarpus siliculosus]|eukprot:CBN74627.1 conserved unknown protein [Ectocarpus siliculosus]
MVFYQQIVTLRPRTNPTDLTNIFRRAAAVILEEGGVVRSVANHGVRVLPYRFHSKHDIKEKDDRWFSSGRWASAYYDASPAVAKKMEEQLWAEDKVIRVSTRRPATKMDRIASTHERSNPWDMEWRNRNGIEQPVHNRRRTPPKKKW